MRLHQKSCPALFIPVPGLFTASHPLLIPLPAVFTPFAASIFPNKLAPNVPNNVARHPAFCYFVSFSMVGVTPFINKLETSRDLTIFLINIFHFFILYY